MPLSKVNLNLQVWDLRKPVLFCHPTASLRPFCFSRVFDSTDRFDLFARVRSTVTTTTTMSRLALRQSRDKSGISRRKRAGRGKRSRYSNPAKLSRRTRRRIETLSQGLRLDLNPMRK